MTTFQILELHFTYDFKYCNCKKVMVDGGLEYTKRVFPPGVNPEEYIDEQSEWEES